jgi:hypothetical protein
MNHQADEVRNFSDILAINAEHNKRMSILAELKNQVQGGNDFELSCKIFHTEDVKQDGRTFEIYEINGHTRRLGLFILYGARGPRGTAFGDTPHQAFTKAFSL